MVFLVGHWNVPHLGCPADMATPAVHARVKLLAGCDGGRLRYVMGHTHCNKPTADGVGYLLGGAGLRGGGGPAAPGCDALGFAYVDSTGGRELVVGFTLADDAMDRWEGGRWCRLLVRSRLCTLRTTACCLRHRCTAPEHHGTVPLASASQLACCVRVLSAYCQPAPVLCAVAGLTSRCRALRRAAWAAACASGRFGTTRQRAPRPMRPRRARTSSKPRGAATYQSLI